MPFLLICYISLIFAENDSGHVPGDKGPSSLVVLEVYDQKFLKFWNETELFLDAIFEFRQLNRMRQNAFLSNMEAFRINF